MPETSHIPLTPRGENLSIIIPTYNCAKYLEETLESLKRQVNGRVDEAQILVLDDCSTKDDPGAVVERVWPGRVRFKRQPKNLGPCANFNSCLDHAEREWIHILHGDDFVFPDAYEEFAACIETTPGAIGVFARAVTVDEASLWTTLPRRFGPDLRGPLPYNADLWATNPVAFPGVFISRRAIDRVGNFDCSFCHCQDWNLWWRIAKEGPVAYSNRCIAAYREFQGNHTSTLLRTGKHLEETLDQIDRLAASVGENGSQPLDTDVLYEITYDKVLSQCRAFSGEAEPFAANFRMFERLPPSFRRRKRRHLVQMRHVQQLLRKRIGGRPS
jgi:glycosyltransferase involved in cell wall biosynthesis